MPFCNRSENRPFCFNARISRLQADLVGQDQHSYLRSNRTRRPRLLSALRDRRKASPEFPGGGALAATRPRSRCVLSDGCPVVRVHLSFGLALHTGHRTDSSASVKDDLFPRFVVFIVAAFEDGQFCSFRDRWLTRHQIGILAST